MLAGCTLQQVMIGESYILETPPSRDCPPLEWRFVVNAQMVMQATVTTSTQQPVAHLAGPFGSDDSFRMTIQGSDRELAIGQFTSQISTIEIQGNWAGSACAGKVYRLRLGSFFARHGGGYSGGGG